MEPLLLSMGKKVVYCGKQAGVEHEDGCQPSAGIMATGLARRSSRAKMRSFHRDRSGNDAFGTYPVPLFEFKKPMLISDNYGAQFALKHMAKDCGLSFRRRMRREPLFRPGMWCSSSTERHGRGLSDKDYAAVKKVIEMMSDPS